MMRTNFQAGTAARPSMLDSILKKKRLRDQADSKKTTPKIPSFFCDDEHDNNSTFLVAAAQQTLFQQPRTEIDQPKWSASDQQLISKLFSLCDDRPVWKAAIDQYRRMIMLGPDTELAQSGKLQAGVKLLLEFFDQEKELVVAEKTLHAVEVVTNEDNVVNDGAQHQWSPEVQLLIDWFAANENKLPTEPFALSACERVTNVVRFFTHIKNNIANVPNLISEGQLLAKLKKLQVVVK
jgi:hypothetical protein